MARHTEVDTPRFIVVDTATADQELRDRRRRARYEDARPGRKHKRPGIANKDRPFVGWDGEGPQDAGYALFGSSMGDEICRPFLSTVDCLELLLSREEATPEAIHVWFGSNYDVSNILKDLPWQKLAALKHWTETEWNDYRIEHIPGKWLKVQKDRLTVKVFDLRPFFAGGYVQALVDMGIGTDEELEHLRSGKASRPEFLFADIQEIAEYFRLELRLMPTLAATLRTSFLGAGYDIKSWHGPGALAHAAMLRHNVPDAMQVSPAEVRIAARYAFAGGRFEMFRGGLIDDVSNADIHSAYPAYATLLPNLARGTWRRTSHINMGVFGVYRIRYDCSDYDPMRPYPLFRRMPDGDVCWPNRVEGWYWQPEAELVANDPDAEVLEGWVFDEEDPSDRPFAWLDEYYRRRQVLKRAGSPLELTYKLIINSVYGQLAQRTGWDRIGKRAPRSHQLEWAGYITSACRAAVYRTAVAAGTALISVDTDGVFASGLQFGDLDMGGDLGQWDVTRYGSGIFWQSGIYGLRDGDEWVKGRTRGLPRGRYSPADLVAAYEKGESLKLVRNQFIGYGLALNGQRDKLNTWEKEPVEIVFGGQGKRYHNTGACGKAFCRNGVHEFIPRPVDMTPDADITSYPHYLPWMDNDPLIDGVKNLISDYALYDVNHLEPDEEWMREYGI